MSATQSGGGAFRFGPFLLDPVRRLLWRDHRVVPLTSRAFDILLLLLQHRDRVVDKDELLATIWTDSIVEEATLVRHISSLRKAMHLRPDQHDYIVTVPKCGYRFVARVVEIEELPSDLPTSAADPVVDEQGRTNGLLQAADQTRATLTGGPGADGPSHQPPAPVHEPAWPRAQLQVMSAALGGVIVVIALTSSFLTPAARDLDDGAPAPRLRQVTYEPGLQQEPTWAPDGQSVAYASDSEGDLDIWVQRVDDPQPRRLTESSAHDSQPDWSPDGEWIAFRSERDGGGVFVVSPQGGPERLLVSGGYRPRWSPDGSQVLFVSSTLRVSAVPQVFVVGREGGSARQVRPDVTNEFRSLDVAWHPDGRRVSFWGTHRTGVPTFITASVGGTDVTRSAITTTVERQITELGLRLTEFAWAPDRNHLYFTGRTDNVRNLWRVTTDPETLAWVKGPVRLTRGAGTDGDMALSRDGARLAFTVRSDRTRLWSFPFDSVTGTLSARAQPLTAQGLDEQSPSIVADGGRLVYRVNQGSYSELREVSTNNRSPRVLARHASGGGRSSPWLSPDGAWVAYDRSGAGENVAAVALLGTNGVERLIEARGVANWTTFGWAPDGGSLLGSCRPTATSGLAVCRMTLPPDQGHATVQPITSRPDTSLYQAQLSPCGRWILFLAIPRFEGGRSTINIVPASGGEWTSLTDGHAYVDKPRWSPDGRSVYFVSTRGGFLNVWARSIDAESGHAIGASRRITTFDGAHEMLSPDQVAAIEIAVASQQLVLPITSSTGAVWMMDGVNR